MLSIVTHYPSKISTPVFTTKWSLFKKGPWRIRTSGGYRDILLRNFSSKLKVRVKCLPRGLNDKES